MYAFLAIVVFYLANLQHNDYHCVSSEVCKFTINVVKLCEHICGCTVMYICEYISAWIMVRHRIVSNKKF